MISFPLFLVVLLWAVVATFLVFRPLPWPERGHRLLGVPDENSRGVVTKIFSKYGLSPLSRFTLGLKGQVQISDQTLFMDQVTVLHLLHEKENVFASGASFPVTNPHAAAEEVCLFLKKNGFAAQIKEICDELPENNFVCVNSNAFQGWTLTFRKGLWGMVPLLGKYIHVHAKK